ncbi:hypothetical protein BT63DRAFT_461175 [Microthyrium microscopicum]|uniref:Uncharacterized protein n=1 Tax=Microthyrium microscopicum TaxID=703497 RepID=A0A6A6TVG5_9PEZI|nr:hypothetical protein BT63DRAFT_461175 [Microthyrium microscopicum]
MNPRAVIRSSGGDLPPLPNPPDWKIKPGESPRVYWIWRAEWEPKWEFWHDWDANGHVVSSPDQVFDGIFGWILPTKINFVPFGWSVDLNSTVWEYLRCRAYGIAAQEPIVPKDLSRKAWIRRAERDISQLDHAIKVLQHLQCLNKIHTNETAYHMAEPWLMDEIKALEQIRLRMTFRFNQRLAR